MSILALLLVSSMAGSYASAEEAKRLASILAQVAWRREVERISSRELTATWQVAEAYNEALAETRAKPSDRVLAGIKVQPADLF
jgi:hypothetical protein